eukprot:scaffold3710_cov286-Chaetoceros_neogracile.AAC.25
MALSLAVLTRHVRTAGAFTMRPLTTGASNSINSSKSGVSSSSGRRIVDLPPASLAAAALLGGNNNLNVRNFSLGVGAVEGETEATTTTTAVDGNDDIVNFPQKGKNVMTAPPRMRFAPSPTGSLHVGGARTALYNWLTAKKGQLDFPNEDSAFIIRVEDTDVARSTKESEDSVLADLRWLGLHWDEGPDIATGKYGPYRQSERGEIYGKLANKLMEEGKAYKCFCTKEELDEVAAKQEAEGLPTRYDGTWRDADPELVQQKLDEGVEYTVRFKVPAGARVVIDDAVRGTVAWDAESTVGDFILLRSSGIPVYNFCVAVDDAAMGVTTVVRAEEHLTNTLRQGLILDSLGAPRPRYAHCSLILGEDKQKLSKRHGATSCNQFRLDGFLPDAMINYLALLGWNDGTENEIFARDELIEAFGVDRVVKSPSIFDMDKLKWINSQHLKQMKVEEITHLVKEQLGYLGVIKEEADEKKIDEFTFAATALAKQMMETTKDAATNAVTVLGYGLPESFEKLEEGQAKKMIKIGNFYPIAQILIHHAEAGELPLPDPQEPHAAFLDENKKAIIEDNQTGGTAYSFPEAYKAYMKQIAKDQMVKGKNLFHPVRLALTGEMSGQDVTKQLALLSLATTEDSIVHQEKAGVVSFRDRIVQLKAFCETIPEEFRAPILDEKALSKESVSTTTEQQKVSIAAPIAGDPLDTYEGPAITSLDIRVGVIKKVWVHPEADKLYCEEIDIGEDEPRQIASGLRPYMDAEDMEGRKVLVLCNLKARKMLGFASHGMVLCASNADHTDVKFVNPPIDAKVGERVTIPGFEFDGEAAAPMKENPMGKKKIFDKIAPFLVTSEYGVPQFLGRPFMTSAGVCTSAISDGTVA